MKYLVLLLVFVPLVTFAENKIDEEAQLEQKAKESPKLYLPKLVEYNEAKLKSTFDQVKSNASPEAVKALERAQSAWWEFYKADAEVAAFDAQGGSYQVPAQYEHRLYQLRLRIYQLSTPFLQGWVSIPKSNSSQEPKK